MVGHHRQPGYTRVSTKNRCPTRVRFLPMCNTTSLISCKTLNTRRDAARALVRLVTDVGGASTVRQKEEMGIASLSKVQIRYGWPDNE